MAYSVRLWLKIQSYWIRITAGSDVRHWGCANTEILSVQMPGVCSAAYFCFAVYGTVHYKVS